MEFAKTVPGERDPTMTLRSPPGPTAIPTALPETAKAAATDAPATADLVSRPQRAPEPGGDSHDKPPDSVQLAKR